MEEGDPFRTGKGVKGPKSHDSTQTLVFYIIYTPFTLHGRTEKTTFFNVKGNIQRFQDDTWKTKQTQKCERTTSSTILCRSKW